MWQVEHNIFGSSLDSLTWGYTRWSIAPPALNIYWRYILMGHNLVNLKHWCVEMSQSCHLWVTKLNPHMDSTINIGIWVLKSASIPSGLCWLVGSSHICIPKFWHWLVFIKVLSILFPNRKHCPNIIIINSLDSILYEVAPIHIGIFTCSEYSAGKGATVHSSDVNDSGRIFLPTTFVSALLSISVEHSSQWIFSYFLEAFSLNILDPVLIWITSGFSMQT